MDRSRVSETTFIILSMASSVALSYLSGGIFVFTLPMLFLGRRIKRTVNYVLLQIVTYICVIAVNLLQYRGFFSSPYWGIIAFSCLMPFVSISQTLVYTSMREKSNSVMRKLVSASIPAFILGTAFAVWLASPVGSESFQTLAASIKQSFENTNAVMGIDFSQISDLMLPMMLIVMVPASMIFAAFPIIVSEFAANSADEQWQYGMANMKMPKKYVLVIAAAVAVTGVSYLVDAVPAYVAVAGWNVGLGMGLHYVLNGYSILVAYFRRRTAYVSAARILVLVVVMGFIPGIGFAVYFGLAVLGILENWIKLR